jgi:hypothetical protein
MRNFKIYTVLERGAWDRRCTWHLLVLREIYPNISVRKPEIKRPGTPRYRYITKRDLQKITSLEWTGYIWLRIGTGVGLC